MDKTALEALVRQVLLERLGGGTHGVKAVQVPRIAVTEEHRMDTGNPLDRVYTRDLFTLQESPRLGVGVMEMTDTTFPWTLNYDEMDYVVSGRLDVLINGEKISAGPGEVRRGQAAWKTGRQCPGRTRGSYPQCPASRPYRQKSVYRSGAGR